MLKQIVLFSFLYCSHCILIEQLGEFDWKLENLGFVENVIYNVNTIDFYYIIN